MVFLWDRGKCRRSCRTWSLPPRLWSHSQDWERNRLVLGRAPRNHGQCVVNIQSPFLAFICLPEFTWTQTIKIAVTGPCSAHSGTGGLFRTRKQMFPYLEDNSGNAPLWWHKLYQQEEGLSYKSGNICNCYVDTLLPRIIAAVSCLPQVEWHRSCCNAKYSMKVH